MASKEWDPTLRDESRAYQLHITLAVMTFLITTTTTARIVTKWLYHLKFAKDDYLIVLGTVCPKPSSPLLPQVCSRTARCHTRTRLTVSDSSR
jgi:hypothetical protein